MNHKAYTRYNQRQLVKYDYENPQAEAEKSGFFPLSPHEFPNLTQKICKILLPLLLGS